MASTRRPEVVVFAGPNGSGKSTLAGLLRPRMAYVNADDIKAAIRCTDMEAALLAEQQRESLLARKADFCFETVLSTDRNLKLLRRARTEGYFVRCYYVITSSPVINILRVSARVADGGHPVPEEKILARYRRALDLVPELIRLCDILHMYDNSGASMRRMFRKRKDRISCDPDALWPLPALERLTGMRGMERADLNAGP